MTNKEKALALISISASGDSERAKKFLAPGYVQHNLAYGAGANAFVGSVAYLTGDPIKTTANSVRASEDEDKVSLQTVYNFAGADEQVAFDTFRLDADGKIAEHWDSLAARAELNPSGHIQVDGHSSLEDLDKTEENREFVRNLLNDVMQGRAPEKTPSYFDDDTYIQYNTGIANSLSGSGVAFEAFGKRGIQIICDVVRQVPAEGDYVLAVSERSFGGAPTSYYDLWRIRDDKTTEHWDVMKIIAKKDTWQNQNGRL